MAGVLADALCGRHGNWARQPQATANTRSHAASRLWAYSGPAPRPRAQVCELATRQHRGICRQQAAGFSAISQPATGPWSAHAIPHAMKH